MRSEGGCTHAVRRRLQRGARASLRAGVAAHAACTRVRPGRAARALFARSRAALPPSCGACGSCARHG
eukprot:523819-Pleurochrysis_carterae.AAC.1